MLIYFFLAFIPICLFFTGSRVNSYRKYWIVCIFLIVFTAFRFDVGYDYPAYWMAISETTDVLIKAFEPGIQLLAWICREIRSPQLFFFLTSTISLLLVFFSIKRYSINPPIALLVFIYLFLTIYFGEVRQAVALSIVFWGFRYVESRSLLKYLCVCLVAVLFHTSALFAILIYFVYTINFWIIFIVAVATPILLMPIFNVMEQMDLYVTHISHEDEYNGGNFISIFYVLLYVTSILLIFLKKGNMRNYPLVKVILITLFLPFFFSPHLSLRIAYYFNIYFCILIPQVLVNQGKNIRFVTVLMLFLYFMLFLYISSLNPSRSPYIPYNMTFFVDSPQFRGI